DESVEERRARLGLAPEPVETLASATARGGEGLRPEPRPWSLPGRSDRAGHVAGGRLFVGRFAGGFVGLLGLLVAVPVDRFAGLFAGRFAGVVGFGATGTGSADVATAAPAESSSTSSSSYVSTSYMPSASSSSGRPSPVATGARVGAPWRRRIQSIASPTTTNPAPKICAVGMSA